MKPVRYPGWHTFHKAVALAVSLMAEKGQCEASVQGDVSEQPRNAARLAEVLTEKLGRPVIASPVGNGRWRFSFL